MITTPKYNIGDKVFIGRYERIEKYIPCPDCLGSTRVRVILGDGTEVSIECGACYPGGFERSTGRIRQYEFTTTTTPHVVTGVSIRSDVIEYELDRSGGRCYVGKEPEIFQTRDEAMAYAETKRQEHQDDENKRWLSKEKDHRSWAFNASYHHREIKDLEKRLEYHRGKVQISMAKSKIEKHPPIKEGDDR